MSILPPTLRDGSQCLPEPTWAAASIPLASPDTIVYPLVPKFVPTL